MRYQIEDEFSVRELDGERIAGPESTRPHPVTGRLRARWTELTLYGTGGGYVVHKVNQSRVWHDVTGADHVRSPAQVIIDCLPEDAVYCAVMPPRDGREQCPPRRPYRAGSIVLAEQPVYAVFRCADYAEVIAQLAVAYRRVSVGAENDPVRRLLAEAALNDPAFAAGIKPVMPL